MDYKIDVLARMYWISYYTDGNYNKRC